MGPSEALFIAQVVVLLLVGRLLGEAMQRIGQPAVMGQLLAGVLLGPSAFGVIWPEAQQALFPAAREQRAMLEAVSQLGILMLLLLTGMETDLKLVSNARRAPIFGRNCPAFRARRDAGSIPSRVYAAAPRRAADHLVVSGNRSLGRLREDRGDGRARDEVRTPQGGNDAARFRHYRRHGRLDDHRDHSQPGFAPPPQCGDPRSKCARDGRFPGG